jgi:tRNA pseudouridine synthase 10
MKASGQSEKSYRALIEFGEDVSEEKLKEVENTLNGAIIMQSTPLRVMHRRADKVREKHIYKLKLTQLEPKKAELYIRCQGGLYVKELISGDGGRTNPSISGLSETTTKCLELDVLEVSLKEF